jgi:putative PIN family toxin of toxin-antitoxin system
MTARVVLDTNVVVSAALKPQGLQSKVLELVASRRLALFASPEVLAEYQEVLLRPKLGLEPGAVNKLLKEIRQAAKLVRVKQRGSVSPDEADNRFLECAEAAQADFLVTGNTRHFPKQYKTTKVVNTREFLNTLRS